MSLIASAPEQGSPGSNVSTMSSPSPTSMKLPAPPLHPNSTMTSPSAVNSITAGATVTCPSFTAEICHTPPIPSCGRAGGAEVLDALGTVVVGPVAEVIEVDGATCSPVEELETLSTVVDVDGAVTWGSSEVVDAEASAPRSLPEQPTRPRSNTSPAAAPSKTAEERAAKASFNRFIYDACVGTSPRPRGHLPSTAPFIPVRR